MSVGGIMHLIWDGILKNKIKNKQGDERKVCSKYWKVHQSSDKYYFSHLHKIQKMVKKGPMS